MFPHVNGQLVLIGGDERAVWTGLGPSDLHHTLGVLLYQRSGQVSIPKVASQVRVAAVNLGAFRAAEMNRNVSK